METEERGEMLGSLPAGSRAPIYIPSTESVTAHIVPRTDDSETFTSQRPPLPAEQSEEVMPKVSCSNKKEKS